jgi:hypothetical protein
MVRQGDVMVIPCMAKPGALDKLEPAPRDGGDVVLAYGEATGHKHRFRRETTEMFVPWPPAATKSEKIEHARKLLRELPALAEHAELIGIVRLREPDDLVHEEHGASQHDRGELLALRQIEYAPDTLRVVTD